MLKIQNIADIRSTKLVDRLVIISHHAQIPILSGKQSYKLELHCIRILILIDHNIAKPLLIILQHIRLRLQKLNRLHQQIIKIQCIIRLQLCLILTVYFCNLQLCKISSCIQFKLIRKDQFILGRRNRRHKASLFKNLCINGDLFTDFFHQSLLVVCIVDRKTVIITKPVYKSS